MFERARAATRGRQRSLRAKRSPPRPACPQRRGRHRRLCPGVSLDGAGAGARRGGRACCGQAASLPPTTTTCHRSCKPEVDEAFAALLTRAAGPRASDLASRGRRGDLAEGAPPGSDPRQRPLPLGAASSSATGSTRRAPNASSVSPRASAARARCSTRARPRSKNHFARLRDLAHTVLGDRTWPMLVCYRVRIGIK